MRAQTHGEATVRPRWMHMIQALAWVYAAMFLSVVLVGYLPGLTNAEGQLLGLFRIELVDDALHLGSAIWAAVAAWISARAATFYFKAFGSIYLLDGIIGFLFGNGILDGGIFMNGMAPLDWGTKLAANLPHLVLGGTAVFIGFVLSRKYAPTA